jgi:hypothetical protein
MLEFYNSTQKRIYFSFMKQNKQHIRFVILQETEKILLFFTRTFS